MGIILASLTGRRCYIDTNVVIYSVEGFTPHEARLRALFLAAEQGKIELVTSELTLAEVLVGPFKRRPPEVASVYQELLGGRGVVAIVPVSREVWVHSAEIRASVGGKLPDSVHAATASLAECDLLLTGDGDLRGPPELRVVRLAHLVVD